MKVPTWAQTWKNHYRRPTTDSKSLTGYQLSIKTAKEESIKFKQALPSPIKTLHHRTLTCWPARRVPSNQTDQVSSFNAFFKINHSPSSTNHHHYASPHSSSFQVDFNPMVKTLQLPQTPPKQLIVTHLCCWHKALQWGTICSGIRAPPLRSWLHRHPKCWPILLSRLTRSLSEATPPT